MSGCLQWSVSIVFSADCIYHIVHSYFILPTVFFFFFFFIFLWVFCVYVPLPPLRGQHTVLCHPRWLPTSGLTEFAVCWGGAGFEPRTTDLQSGALPLSHLSSLIEPPLLLNWGVYVCDHAISKNKFKYNSTIWFTFYLQRKKKSDVCTAKLSGISTIYTNVQRNEDYINHNNGLGQHVCEGAHTYTRLPKSHVSSLLRLPTHFFSHPCVVRASPWQPLADFLAPFLRQGSIIHSHFRSSMTHIHKYKTDYIRPVRDLVYTSSPSSTVSTV